jgi:hypothetical protein
MIPSCSHPSAATQITHTLSYGADVDVSSCDGKRNPYFRIHEIRVRLTKLIPAPLRTKIKAILRDRAIESALMPLRATGTMSEPQIAAFHKAWAAESFSADRTYIGRIIQLINANLNSVLECGTGATTLVANELGLRHGFKIYSLEQNLTWVEDMTGRNLEAVKIVHAPLKQISTDYQWYDVRDSALPTHFSLVICDGPFIDVGLGEPIYSGWRYGVMPWLKNTSRTFDVLLLDDVDDKRAPAILDRWQREFGVQIERPASSNGRWAIIRPS